jgi:hypothetical protein
MQTNTTGHFMELLLILLIVLVFILVIRVNKTIRLQEDVKSGQIELDKNYCFIKRFAEDIKDQQVEIEKKISSFPTAPSSPIRPNNWDSMKKCFRGPVRTEINE